MKRGLLPLGFALLLVAFLWRWEGGERPVGEAVRTEMPDLVLTRFRAEQFDIRGHLLQRLEGEAYRHWRARDLAEIDAPRLTLPAGPAIWSARGGRARLLADEYLVVTGAVTVERRRGDERLALHSPQVRAWLSRRYLEGDGPVRLEAPWGEAGAGALAADLALDRVRLEGGVRSLYRPGGRG